MTPKTHLAIDPSLCGTVQELSPGRATVTLPTTDVMRADERGLVHGGFIFGLADYAAMLAVNDPLVVLGSAEARFLAPVRVGEVVTAEAEVLREEGRRRAVSVAARVSDRAVFRGELTTFVLDKHVLD